MPIEYRISIGFSGLERDEDSLKKARRPFLEAGL
jgi:hypothetical protein